MNTKQDQEWGRAEPWAGSLSHVTATIRVGSLNYSVGGVTESCHYNNKSGVTEPFRVGGDPVSGDAIT